MRSRVSCAGATLQNALACFKKNRPRGRFLLVVRQALCCLDVADGDLAGSAVFLGIEGDFLAFGQVTHSGALKRGGMDKHVLAAIIRLNKAKAFLVVLPPQTLSRQERYGATRGRANDAAVSMSVVPEFVRIDRSRAD
jgi:hypothetical protein